MNDMTELTTTLPAEHLVLSQEFLVLLQWIIDHEAETLKKIITRALKNNFMHYYGSTHQASDAELQQSIVDFLTIFDALLLEVTQEHTAQKQLDRNLIPALNHLDSHVCSEKMIASSLAKIDVQDSQVSKETMQDLLLKELLKRWKPDKKAVLN